MNLTILLLPWLLVQLDNTDTIRKPLPVPVDPQSVESQFRMFIYLSKFVEICQPHVRINRAVADVELVKLRTEALAMKGATVALYDEAVQAETEVRDLAIRIVGEKVWCDTNKFVLTAHGYERLFKESEEK